MEFQINASNSDSLNDQEENSYIYGVFERTCEYFAKELVSIFDYKFLTNAFFVEYNRANPQSEVKLSIYNQELLSNISKQMSLYCKDIIMEILKKSYKEKFKGKLEKIYNLKCIEEICTSIGLNNQVAEKETSNGAENIIEQILVETLKKQFGENPLGSL